MPPKKQHYSLRRVRKNYTYSVEEIAELFGVCHPTVFRWIKDEGLGRLPNSKKYFVHGADLVRFLERKTEKRKRPMTDGEMYCCKCRKPQHPVHASIIVKNLPNKTVRIFGMCAVCATKMNKVVSEKKWDKNHPLYPHNNADTKQHKGMQETQRKCEDRKEEQLCLNITL
jgi:hypothetical protein